MRTLTYETYLDKVWGCFLGKCIGGTAGGPAEGRKELLDYPLHEPLLHQALPNDDLDLQILWLEVLEEKGVYITSRDLADAFYKKVPYGPGEYAYFKKNYGRGIYPPLSGSYNNRYYQNGMGCPIRSEIWACLFPGDVEAARPYIEMDGCMDHLRDSIDAEVFLAAMESEAFFTDDLNELIEYGLSKIPAGTRLDKALRMACDCFRAGYDWKKTRGMILKNFGHADCTNLYQNMAFILLTLLYGGYDFREIVRLGLACGYDTDCICASAASVAGTIFGGKKITGEMGLEDTGLKIEVQTRRRDGSIYDLAADVCSAGLTMMRVKNADTLVTDAPPVKGVPAEDKTPALTFSVSYEGNPVVKAGEEAHMTLSIVNHTGAPVEAELTVAPEKDDLYITPGRLSVRIDKELQIPLTAGLMPGRRALCQKNLFTVCARGSFGVIEDVFGIVGAEIWQHYGPYLANIRDLTHVPPEAGYGAYLTPESGENGMDLVREYHLSHIADINTPFVDESEPFTDIPDDGTAWCVPTQIQLEEDLFDAAVIQPFEGPHVGYLKRIVTCPEERDVELTVGRTAPCKVWLNGKLVIDSTAGFPALQAGAWWTCENLRAPVHFSEGENVLILKYAQTTDTAKFSVMYRIPTGHWRQFEDMGSAF